jgi:hypothetical protein
MLHKHHPHQSPVPPTITSHFHNCLPASNPGSHFGGDLACLRKSQES